MALTKLINDKRGAALIYVIVASALMVILGAATTATAYVNLKTTQVQEQTDDNFYNLDSIVNLVMSGLEGDMSKAYETAYTEAITTLNTYETVEEARENFSALFLKELNLYLSDGKGMVNNRYELSVLQNYIDVMFTDENAYRSDVRYTISALNGENYLDSIEDGLILRNLHLTYEDDTGYFDEITTDIKITVPDFEPQFIQSKRLDVDAIVADEGLTIGFGRGMQINGNTYLTEGRTTDSNKNQLNDKDTAVYMDNNSSFVVNSPQTVVLAGNAITGDNIEFSVRGKDDKKANRLWAENFDFGESAKVYLSGQSFVGDDLEINGSNSKIKLLGEYYGYNQGGTPESSSAININGARTTLDMTELDMLVIAGSSFLTTTEMEENPAKSNNGKTLQLGESFSVKSNQVAYLVDDKEFIGTTYSDFTSNPMSEDQYTELCVNHGGEASLLQGLLREVDLSYENKPYSEYASKITPIHSAKGGGTVTLYLEFANADDASDYFRMVFKGNSLLSQRLRTYAGQYIESLKLNPSTAILVNQNYIDQTIAVYSNDMLANGNSGMGLGYKKNPPTGMDEMLSGLIKEYNGDPVESLVGMKDKMSCEELVNENQVRAFIDNVTALVEAGTGVEANTEVKLDCGPNYAIVTGATNASAVVVDNDGASPYVVYGGSGLVVATGDVIVAGDWLGSIIAGGRIYCAGGSQDNPITLTTDATVTASVLPLYFYPNPGDDTTTMCVYNIFEGYQDYQVNPATQESGVNANLISSCLTLSNWSRN